MILDLFSAFLLVYIFHSFTNHLLIISKGKDLRFERANFKLTKEMINILGGNEKTEAYNLFVNLTVKAFLVIR